MEKSLAACCQWNQINIEAGVVALVQMDIASENMALVSSGFWNVPE